MAAQPITLYIGKSAEIPFILTSNVALGTQFVATIKKTNRSTEILAQSSSFTYDSASLSGTVKFLDADTENLVLGDVVIELQAIYSIDENYVVIQNPGVVIQPLRE